MKKHVLAAVSSLVLAGSTLAQEPLITHERFVGTKQGIESLTPDQKARFDTEKARLLAEIGRGPDGQLLAPANPEPAKPARKAKKARKSRKARKAQSEHVSNEKVDAVARVPTQTIRDSNILGAPVQGSKQSPVQY